MKYIYIICPFVALITCQIIKFIIESIQSKKFEIKRLISGSGGMPSTHSSFSSSLTTLIGLKLGLDNPIFAVSFVFTLITSYDAMGVRFESGRHAKALNYILGKNDSFETFKEKLGHEPLEVITGIAVGIIVGTIMSIF